MATITILILTSIFALVYICTAIALNESEGLRDGRFVLAFPVSMLCVLGMLRGINNSPKKSLVDVVIFPYEVLVYAIIAVVILLLLSRFLVPIGKKIEYLIVDAVMKLEERKRKRIAEQEKEYRIKAEKMKKSKIDKTIHVEDLL